MKQLVYLLIVALIVSCNQTSQTNNVVAKNIPAIDTIRLKTEIVQTSIDFEKLQWFYIDTTSLVLMKNENTERLIDLQKFDSPVILKYSQEINEDNISHYLKINEFIFYNDSAYIELEYPSQGAVAKLKLKKESGLWEIFSYEIYEY